MGQFLVGILLNSAYGIILGFILSESFGKILFGNYIFAGQTILMIGLAALFVVLAAHTVPTQNRGVLYSLGRRLRTGTDEKGYIEGFVVTLFPRPINDVEMVDCSEKTMDLCGTEVVSEDNLNVGIDVFLQHQVDDPYDYKSTATPEAALKALALSAIRTRGATQTAKDLAHSKDEIANDLRYIIDSVISSSAPAAPGISSAPAAPTPIATAVQTKEPMRWGLKVKLVRVQHVVLPSSLTKAYERKVIEPIETQSEETQVKARLKQVKELVTAGVDPNVAIASALMDAGKPSQVISVTGFEGLGGALKDLGDASRAFSSVKSGGAKPAKGGH